MKLRTCRRVLGPGLVMAAVAGGAGTAASVFAQEVQQFPIVRFKVEGNSLLPQAEIDAVLRSYLGAEQDFGKVQQALEALEALYRERGYATVAVLLPEQVLESGEVKLRVLEGRLRRIGVEGARYFDEDNIRRSLPALRLGEVPRIDDTSASLRVINENPAKKLTLRLAPTEREDQIDALVRVVDERPWQIATTLDNSGTERTGKYRLGVSLQHANLWHRDHVLTYQYQTSPDQPDDVEVHALAYRLPLYGLGDAFDFYATRSNVNAGTMTAGPVDLAISGSGTTVGGRYTWNLKRQGSFEHQLAFGLERKAYENNIGANGVALGSDIAVTPLSFQYGGRWLAERSQANWQAAVARNLPGGKQGSQNDFERARSGAGKDFSVLRAGFSLGHLYANDWQARASASLQWTRDLLIPGEQLGIGGAATVRGFDEREVAADRGYQASLELHTPEWCAPPGGDQRCRALVFFDAGTVYRLDPMPGEQAREHIASAGFGLRYQWNRFINLQADYGNVLQGGGARQPGDWRWHARLTLTY